LTLNFDELDALMKKNKNFMDDLFPRGICNYNPTYALLHPWKISEYYWQELIYAWERVTKGYDRRVIWSIDWYLSEMIPKWVMELKKTSYGIPSEMFEDSDWDNDKCEYIPGAEDRAVKKWHDILDQIALGFECHNLINKESLWIQSVGYSELNAEFEKGFDLFKKHFGSFWD
jgi:hypothetical protein